MIRIVTGEKPGIIFLHFLPQPIQEISVDAIKPLFKNSNSIDLFTLYIHVEELLMSMMKSYKS